MNKRPALLRWLEQIGDLESVKDSKAVVALELMCAHVTGERVNLKPRYQDEDYDDFWTIRVHVCGFLRNAASIAEGEDDSQRRNKILRGAVARVRTRDQRDGLPRLERAFVVRAVIPAAGDPRLEVVGPVDASPEFCVRYAMWLVALEVPVEKWRRYRLRTCERKSCRKKFYDTRWVMKHGPRRYCSPDCQVRRLR